MHLHVSSLSNRDYLLINAGYCNCKRTCITKYNNMYILAMYNIHIMYASIRIGIIIEQSNRMDNATFCKSFKIISHEKFNEEKCYNVTICSMFASVSCAMCLPRNENRFVIVNDVEYNENSNALLGTMCTEIH